MVLELYGFRTTLKFCNSQLITISIKIANLLALLYSKTHDVMIKIKTGNLVYVVKII